MWLKDNILQNNPVNVQDILTFTEKQAKHFLPSHPT